jgi:hypothetical protein
VTQWKRKGNNEDELLQSFYCSTEDRVNGWKRGNFFYGVFAKMFTPNLRCKYIHHSIPFHLLPLHSISFFKFSGAQPKE